MGVVGLANPRHGHLLLGWATVPHRRHRRNSRPPAGHDAANRPGDHGSLHRVVGRNPEHRRSPAQLLVGTGTISGHYAAGPLDRTALPGPDNLGPGLPGGPAAG